MCFAGCASGVYHVDSVRLAGCDGQVCMADTPEKGPAFLLKTVLVSFRAFIRPGAFVPSIATAGALDAECHFVVEHDRQVGLQVAAEDFVHLQNGLRAYLAASTLISLSRIGETIAEHDASFGERGQNHLVNVLGAGSEHERHFRERRESRGGGVQQHFANLFASGGAARFAGDGDREAVSAQRSRQFFDLSALAAAVETFEGDKFSACGHVGNDSRRWKRAGAVSEWTAAANRPRERISCGLVY